MPFLSSNQQCQITEGNSFKCYLGKSTTSFILPTSTTELVRKAALLHPQLLSDTSTLVATTDSHLISYAATPLHSNHITA